jgi:hypothetical protein
MADPKARVAAIIAAHAPDKVGSVPQMLATYAGREDDLVSALEQRFGIAPGAPLGGATSTAPGSSAHRDRLVRFYTKYAPDKLPEVDSILTKYAGKETKMFQVLVDRYGPEPDATAGASQGDYHGRLTRYLLKYAPERVASVETMLEKYRGHEEEMFATLVSKLGPEPPSTAAPNAQAAASASPAAPSPFRDRLVRFYTKYAPDKLPEVDVLLAKYAGKEVKMFEVLAERYGPEPAAADVPVRNNNATTTQPQPTPPSPTPAPPSHSGATNDYRGRLTRYLQQYAPDKVGGVDSMLDKYRGREEELFATLVSKLGPEPSSSGTSTQPAAAPLATAPVASPAVPPAHRDRLVRFYAKYSPDKLPEVDSILTKYAGKETKMFQVLVDRYGPEPDATATRVATPPPVNPVSTSVPAPTAASSGDYRARVVRMLEAYAPDKAGNADAMLAKYRGEEDKLLATLVSKLGPEPPATGSAAQVPPPAPAPAPTAPLPSAQPATVVASVAPPSAPPNPHRERLVRFYAKYAPDKLVDVDKILTSYAGKEAQMFETLVKRYGPEPADQSTAAPAATTAETTRTRTATVIEAPQPPKPITTSSREDFPFGHEFDQRNGGNAALRTLITNVLQQRAPGFLPRGCDVFLFVGHYVAKAGGEGLTTLDQFP